MLRYYRAFRAFHLDALIVHPRVFKKKHRIKASDVKVTNTDNAPKRGRGRPMMNAIMIANSVINKIFIFSFCFSLLLQKDSNLQPRI